MTMKHFGIYRKLILIIGTATAVVSVGVFFFMEDILFRTLFISFAFVFLCGLLFLMDFLHNRYNDNLLEEITLLIEALVEQQERMVFSEAEDTLTARLQHQLLKLRNILKAQNQMLTQEKEQIKTLISDISHQIKTPVAAANTFAQLLGDTGLSDEERSEYIATLQMSLEKLTFLTNSLIKMSRLESGIIRLKPEQNSLNDIVMQAVKTVYAKARDKNITITFDCFFIVFFPFRRVVIRKCDRKITPLVVLLSNRADHILRTDSFNIFQILNLLFLLFCRHRKGRISGCACGTHLH
jgi:signal transduction histidine kinase